jgi:hypothetical protein
MRPGLALVGGLLISVFGLATVFVSTADLVGVLLIAGGVAVAVAGNRVPAAE